MQHPQQMNRLLQGDVGSGKTIVATIAALVAIENGYQAVIMWLQLKFWQDNIIKRLKI